MKRRDPLTPDESARLQAALASLPPLAPPDGWPRLIAAYRTRPASSARLTITGLAAAAALGLIALGFLLRDFDSGYNERVAVAEVERLQLRSAELEQSLAAFPERRVVRAGSGFTAVTLQDHILLVDEQLSEPASARPSSRTRELWRERVALLDALVGLRSSAPAELTF
jgi:hypothetical protein